MKKVIYERYGPPEVLQLVNAEKPTPKADEVLVRIYATSVTAGDWRMRKADPFWARFFNGLFTPTRIKTLGFEYAGIIEAIGEKVTNFKPGDKVFGPASRFGAYAEYLCVPSDGKLAMIPDNLSFEEAATMPIGALTAIYYLTKKVLLQANQRILIYGASGSVGTYAVQLAKHLGAHVTAVCSTNNIALVTSLGADEVLDYTQVNYWERKDRFDVVFDAVGKTDRSKAREVLSPKGKFITVNKGLARVTLKELLELKDLIVKGKLRSVIDRTYTLDQIREAHAYVQQHHKRGNVAVTVHEL